MWLKVRAIWQFVHRHYLDDFDIFHIGGDDHYLIVENLKYMVQTQQFGAAMPLFLGGSMVDFPITQHRYCGGGSGYSLNRAAVRLLVEDTFPYHWCRPHHQAADEDRWIACLLYTSPSPRD